VASFAIQKLPTDLHISFTVLYIFTSVSESSLLEILRFVKCVIIIIKKIIINNNNNNTYVRALYVFSADVHCQVAGNVTMDTIADLVSPSSVENVSMFVFLGACSFSFCLLCL